MKIFSIEICDMGISKFLESINPDRFMFVVTPNVQHVVFLNKNPSVLNEYQKADFTFCDSRVLQLIAKLLKLKIKNVIPGSDLTERLFSSGCLIDRRVMVLGSDSDSVRLLTEKYSLKDCKCYSPPMGFFDNKYEVDKAINEVLLFSPEFLFLAVGFPRQELLAAMLKEKANFPCVALCIGASIDFITGKQVRAPQWWQNLRLEWLFRFISNPRRLFKRYFIEGWGIIPLIYKELMGAKD